MREWALPQAPNGFSNYDSAPETFRLSSEQATVFVNKDSPVSLEVTAVRAVTAWVHKLDMGCIYETAKLHSPDPISDPGRMQRNELFEWQDSSFRDTKIRACREG